MLAIAFAGSAQQCDAEVQWSVGDVFVAAGNSTYQIWHSANPGANNPSYSKLDTINDGLNGLNTAGCGFDTGYRLFGTDSSKNSTVRFTIDNGHPPLTPAITPTANLRNSQSVALDGNGRIYVGYADSGTAIGQGGFEVYQHDGTLIHSFTAPNLAVENSGAGWLDVAQDGHTVFYTSGGRKIFMIDTEAASPASITYADLSLFGGTISAGKLFAIHVLPSSDGIPGSAGVLVADQGNVKLVKASCNNGICGVPSVTILKFKNESNLQALGLDPINPATIFWVGDASSRDFMRFNLATGKTEVTLNTGAGTMLGGICVDGGFSAAALAFAPQPPVNTQPTQTFALTPASSTFQFTSPFTQTKLTATLASLQNNATVTVRDSLVDPVVATSDPTVYSFNLGNPKFSISTVSGHMICDTRPADVTGNASYMGKCEIFEFEANPNFGYTMADVKLDIASVSQDVPNVRFLRNFDEDITTGIVDYPLSGTRSKCVFSVNKQLSDGTIEVCGGGFSSPVNGQNFSKKQTSSIAFKFKVAPAGTCPNGAGFPTTLQPLLLITQILPPDPITGLSPAPAPVTVIVAGNSGGPPIFTLTGNAWQLQVKTSDLPAGFSYLATVLDLGSQIPSFSVQFSLN